MGGGYKNMLLSLVALKNAIVHEWPSIYTHFLVISIKKIYIKENII